MDNNFNSHNIIPENLHNCGSFCRQTGCAAVKKKGSYAPIQGSSGVQTQIERANSVSITLKCVTKYNINACKKL